MTGRCDRNQRIGHSAKAGCASSATVLFGSVYLATGESRPSPDDEDRRVPLSWVGANHVKPPRSEKAVPGRTEAAPAGGLEPSQAGGVHEVPAARRMLNSVDVAVVGAGITGLTAAHRLPAELSVAVIEAHPRPGGKVRTASLAGVPVECGPDSFLARSSGVARLCSELGLGDRLVAPATTGRQSGREVVSGSFPRACNLAFHRVRPSSSLRAS